MEREIRIGEADIETGEGRGGGGEKTGWRLHGGIKEVGGDRENYFWGGSVGAREGEKKMDNAGNGRIFSVYRHTRYFIRQFITTSLPSRS